jgi:hypothetical protein
MIRALIDAASEARRTGNTSGLEKVIDAMFEKATGITVQEPDGHGGERVYTQPPDVAAAKLLTENRFGRPKETVEVQQPDLAPSSVPFLVIPQLPAIKK